MGITVKLLTPTTKNKPANVFQYIEYCVICSTNESTTVTWLLLGALVFSLICAWTNGWVNNRGACDLRRHCAHYDVMVMREQSLPMAVTEDYSKKTGPTNGFRWYIRSTKFYLSNHVLAQWLSQLTIYLIFSGFESWFTNHGSSAL